MGLNKLADRTNSGTRSWPQFASSSTFAEPNPLLDIYCWSVAVVQRRPEYGNNTKRAAALTVLETKKRFMVSMVCLRYMANWVGRGKLADVCFEGSLRLTQ